MLGCRNVDMCVGGLLMISGLIYLAILCVVFLMYGTYLVGHQAGYNKARRDYRQGLRLVEGVERESR